MKKIIWFSFVTVFLSISAVFAQTVNISFPKGSQQAGYAAGILQNSLLKKGYTFKQTNAEYKISISIDSVGLGSEAFTVATTRKKISVKGGDAR